MQIVQKARKPNGFGLFYFLPKQNFTKKRRISAGFPAGLSNFYFSPAGAVLFT
jgi:hypothetical protein